MSNETGKEVPSFAEIRHMHTNRPAAFEKTVRGLVSMQDCVTTSRKEVTSAVNFLSQGKLVCLALKDYIAALKSKTTTALDFPEYFLWTYGGKIPGAGHTLAMVFSVHCLAPETAARYVPESVYDGCYCRVLQAAGKVAKVASGIEGATPETSGLNHQVFADVADVLKRHGKNAAKELYVIHDRLVWDVKMDGDDEIKTLHYLSVEELASRRVTNAC